MSELLSQMLYHQALAGRTRRQCAVATFTREHSCTVSAWYQCSNAETRTWSKHGKWRPALSGAAAAKRIKIGPTEMGKRPGNRLKIIDQTDAGKSKSPLQLGSIDDPRDVGQSAAFIIDNTGHGEHSSAEMRIRVASREEIGKSIGK